MLLWRGSRDGFGVRDFHGRCNGHAPTLTLIQDIVGNIFGGFTSVEWESRTEDFHESFKADLSLASFLFTLKNPRNFLARKFALNVNKLHRAIGCLTSRGPHFGDEISICSGCNVKPYRWSELGYSYANDTGLDGNTVLTGSQQFIVKEIEVFEITD
jgi:hypothetical protein